MRQIMVMVALVVCGLPVPSGMAQESEMVKPDTPLRIAIAFTNEDGQLELEYGGAADTPVEENATQTYTVMVPYTEVTEVDGEKKTVTKMRVETRTRTVPVKRMIPTPNQTHDWKQLGYYRLSGERIPMHQAVKQLESRQPVVVLEKGKKLDPVYEMMLRDDVLIIELPAPRPLPRAGGRI